MTEPRQFGRETPERQYEIDRRVQTQDQIDEARRLRAEHWDRNEHQMHCYQVTRQLIFDLKVDLGRMATAEEKNGNYKTADMLTAIRLRLRTDLDVQNVARLARERGE
jgi:hypothetical protein